MTNDLKPLNLKLFFLAVLFWMSCCFVFWYLLHDMIIQPAALLSGMVLDSLLPDVLDEMKLHKGQLVLITQLGELNGTIMPAHQAGNQIAYQINPKVVSYSLPFIVSLLLASSDRKTFNKILISLCILYPIVVSGIIFQSLKELLFGSRRMHDYLTGQSDVTMLHEVIAIGYQFSTLIIPAVAPIIIWSWLENKRVSTLIARAPDQDNP